MEPEQRLRARLRPGCICMGIPLLAILDAVEQGAASFEEVARRTGMGRGDCGGRRCRARVEEILESQKTGDG